MVQMGEKNAGFCSYFQPSQRLGSKWCPEEDSNLHDLAIAST
jgi:hypothetical protein